MHPNNVTEIIVPADMCCGCGVCAGICPVSCLEMQMSQGLYRPALVSKCLTSCDICLVTCPFYDQDPSRDEIARELFQGQQGVQHYQVVGYYLQAYAGYSLIGGHRERGASGGMATWTLERLLATHAVDRVIAVGAAQGPDRPLFQYEIYDNVEQIRNAASSKYYPVEISQALKAVWKDKKDHRYAIVGLPCTLQAIRHAASRHPRLKKHVRFLLGIVCNHCPGSYYTEFLCAMAGVSTADVHAVDYRYKIGTQRANDFQFRALLKDGNWSRPVGFQGQVASIWNKQYFTYDACSYCEDVFAETADAVFMDAWLDRFMPDTRGTSLVVVRNAQLESILEKGRQEGLCELTPVPIEDVVNSQSSVVHHKKETIRYRLLARQQAGGWLPKMQTQPAMDADETELRAARLEARTIRASKNVWSFFRRMPARSLPTLLPVYWRAVGLIARDPDALRGITFRAWVVSGLKAIRLYPVARRLWRFGRSIKSRILDLIAQHFLLILPLTYAMLLGWTRRIRQKNTSTHSVLILPPWSPGSLGDEAVEMAFVDGLRVRGVKTITMISYTPEDDWSHLGLTGESVAMQFSSISRSWRDQLRFVRTVRHYDQFYALGTDVMDGAYNVADTLSRIALTSLAATVGVDASIINFSFNKNPSADVVTALRSLPTRVRLCVRDPISQERLLHHLQRPVELTADLAFTLRSEHDSANALATVDWIRGQHQSGRSVVGINVSQHLLTVVPGLTLERIIECYASTLQELLHREETLSFVLIPHAFNQGTDDLTIAQALLNAIPAEVRLHTLLFVAHRATEVQTVCGELDIALSGRMHCAIACLSRGTPVACVAYQDKFEGLFKHFGLEGMTIDAEVSLQSDRLLEFFLPIYWNRDRLRTQIKSRLPAVRKLAESNFGI